MNRPIALIGPSGAGKSTLAHELAKHPALQLVKTVTTRAPRVGEILPNHDFITQEAFDRLRDNGSLIGWQQLFGNNYGLRRFDSSLPDTISPLVVLPTALLDMVIEHHPDIFVIAIHAPKETLTERVIQRGDRGRLSVAQFEEGLRESEERAHLIIDTRESIETCLARIRKAIGVDVDDMMPRRSH